MLGDESLVEPPCEEFDILDRTHTFASEATASGFVTETILQFRNGKGCPESEFSMNAISYEQIKKGIAINNKAFQVGGYGFLLSGKKNSYEEEVPLTVVAFTVMEDWYNKDGIYVITPCIVQLQCVMSGSPKKDPSVKLVSSFQWTDALSCLVEVFAKCNNYEGVGIMPADGNLSVGKSTNLTMERAKKIYDETAIRRNMESVNGLFYKQFKN